MISFLNGSDMFRLGRREQELVQAFYHGQENGEEWTIDFRDPEIKPLEILSQALAPSLFAPVKLFRLRHVELLPEPIAEKFFKTLSLANLDGLEIIATAETGGRAKKKNILEEWLAKKGKTETFTSLSGAALLAEAENILKVIDPSIKIEKRALTLLIERNGGRSGFLYCDLWKLALAFPGREITVADVAALTTEPERESVAFALLDALVRGDRERALVLLREEITDDSEIFRLLGLFAWQLRLALMVRDEYDRGTTSGEKIAANINAKPFAVKKLLLLLPRLTMIRLKHAFTHLATLDRQLKSGEAVPGAALDLFVWKF